MRKKREVKKRKKTTKFLKSNELVKKDNELVKKDMELINNENLFKKNYNEKKSHVWCGERERRIHIALCDKACSQGFCSYRMELFDDNSDESYNYQNLNNKTIVKAIINEKTQRRLYLYLNDGRQIIILGGFNIYDKSPIQETVKESNEIKRKFIKKEIKSPTKSILRKPILKIKKGNKKLKNSVQNNGSIEKPNTIKIIKKKLKTKFK